MTEQAVPDLYELAFMPGQFRCPQCEFQWSIQTMCVASGRIGTTEENRQAPDCPNDGTRMVHVTYREQLEAYADRLKEEFDNRDRLREGLRELAERWRTRSREFGDCRADDSDSGMQHCYQVCADELEAENAPKTSA